jgi:Fic family protein
MLRHGFWMEKFFSIPPKILKAPKKCYRAFLHTETDENDLNYFIHHQLKVIRASLTSLQQHILRKQAEVESLRRHLGPQTDFNHRQLSLLEHPFAAYTVVSHQTSHGTPIAPGLSRTGYKIPPRRSGPDTAIAV